MPTVQSRRARVLPKALAGAAVIAAVAYCPKSFVSPYISTQGGRDLSAVTRGDGAVADFGIQKWEKNRNWQHGLDTTFFDFGASISDRVDGIRAAFANRETLVGDVAEAATLLREKGLDGRQEALDMLLPKGTYARADIDAVVNIFDSVQKSVPDLTPELQRMRKDIELLRDDVAAQVPDSVKSFAESAARTILPIGVDLAPQQAAESFRMLQSDNKEEFAYLVVKETRDFEIRAYQPYSIVRRKTSSMSQAFADLTEYLMKQPKAASMKLVLPAMIEHAIDEAPDQAKGLAFGLEAKSDIALAEKDPNIEVKKVPMQFFAVRRLGQSTDAEAQHQLDKLRQAVAGDGTYEVLPDNRYTVFQYYGPRSASLWRRKTEVAVRVKAS